MRLDGLIYPLGGGGQSPTVGLEMKYVADGIRRSGLERAVNRLIALRSSGAIDGGMVVVNVEVQHYTIGSMHADDDRTTPSVSIFSIDRLRRDLETGAFETYWKRYLDLLLPSTSTSSKSAKKPEKLLAVCMPYTSHFEDVFNYGIAPVARRLGYTAQRVKDHPSYGTIIDDIHRDLRAASGVICDVTGLNANVLYEVGYSKAIPKTTILIAAEGSEFTFNTRGYRHLLYNNISNLEQLLDAEIQMMQRDRKL